jgi:membrane protease YdiL (CAAX protease family)
MRPEAKPPKGGRVQRVAVSVIIYGLATLAAALLCALAELPSLFTPPKEGLLVPTVIIALALTGLVVLGGRWLERTAWYARMADVLRDPVRLLLGPRSGVPEQFLVAFSSAMGEETFFRGFCQPGLARLLARTTSLDPAVATGLAILATAFSFMLLHPPWKRELRPWTLFAFLMGTSWGLLAHATGSLLGPVLSHFLVNFLNLRRLLATPGHIARDSERC